MSEIKAFIDQRVYKVTGYLHPTDAMAIAGLSAWQNSNNIAGSVMEIGVFYGRSFVLMAKARGSIPTIAVACDLFDIDIIADGDSLQLRSFKELLKREGIPESTVKIMQVDSTRLAPNDILSITTKMRLFSIDGGHEERQVRSDAELALSVLCDDGIIIFDDFFNPRHPGVTFAVMNFLENRRSEILPFLITNNKLYVCRANLVQSYQTAVTEMHLWAGAQIDQFVFKNDKIIYLFQTLPHRAIYQLMAGFGLGNLAAALIPTAVHGFLADRGAQNRQ